MASTYNKEWNNLSIEEKRDVIRVALKNGIRELPDIKAKYNEFAGGGSFYQRHRARWNNYLLRHGVPEQQAAKLSTFFAAQDALESDHGTSDAAKGKNNFGGMQYLDKKSNKMVNISYPSVDAYMDAKWKMMQNRFGRALNANSIQEYSNLLNDPRYHGKGYMYALYEGYRDGKPLDVAKQTQHMNNYTKILMDIAGEKGFKGAPIPAGQAGEAPASIARPENPYTQYTPAEPFFNQNMTFVRPEDVRKVQEENALKMAESQNAAMQQERKQNVDSFNTLMSLLHTPNNGNSGILGTIATLASLNKNNRFDTGGFKQQPRQYIYDVLPSLFAKDGVKITVSSGFRPGAKTVEGKPSRHSLKQAADIVGDFKAIRRVLDDPNSYTSRWLLANGYGYLDETSATGTTKFWHDHKRDHSHYHIGMDSGIVSKYANMMRGRAQNPLPAQQDIVEQPIELAQTTPDIPFTPSNPQAFFGVHPAQQQSVYDYVTTPTVEEPVYDPMVEEKNDALSNLSKINAIMQLTSPSNSGNNNFLNTVGLLANMSAEGGKIHIKPENRGKFTALKERTGHSATWFKEHGTPAQKKMAVFALNARHWKHGLGGNLYLFGGDDDNNPRPVTTGGAGYIPNNYGQGAVDNIRRALYDNVTPFGYHNPIQRVTDAIIYDKQDGSRAGENTLIGSGDAEASALDALWGTYLGIPANQRRKIHSKYNISKVPEGYYKFNDPNLILDFNSDLSPQGLYSQKNRKIQHMNGILGNHTVGLGRDNKGDYIYYSDSNLNKDGSPNLKTGWDINPYSNTVDDATEETTESKGQYGQSKKSLSYKIGKALFGNISDLSMGIGKAVPVYDKIYLDDYYGVSSPYRGSSYLPEVTVTGKKRRGKKHGYGGNIYDGTTEGTQQMKGREGAARSYIIDGITYGAPYYNYDEPGRPLYRNATLPEIVITPPAWNFEREKEKALIRKRRNSKYTYIPETPGTKVYDAAKEGKVRKTIDKVLDFAGFNKSDQRRMLSDLQYLGLAAEGGENGTTYGVVAPGVLDGMPVGKGVNTGLEVLSKKAAAENLTPTQRIFKFLGKDVPSEKASEWVKPEGVSEAKNARWSMRHQIVRDHPLIADLRAQGVDVEKIGLDDLKKLQELRKKAIKDAFETSDGRYAITDATSGAKLYGENVGAELQTYKGKPAEPGAIGSLTFEGVPLDKYLEMEWARYDRAGAVPVLNPELYEGLKVPGMVQNYARDYGVKGVSKDLYSASLFDMAERGTGKGIASGTVLLSPEKTTRVVSPKNFNLVEISPDAGWHKYTMETLDGTPAASWQEGPITGITGTTAPIQFPVKNGQLFDVGIIDESGVMHIDPTIGSSVRKSYGGTLHRKHLFDGTTEDTQQMNIPFEIVGKGQLNPELNYSNITVGGRKGTLLSANYDTNLGRIKYDDGTEEDVQLARNFWINSKNNSSNSSGSKTLTEIIPQYNWDRDSYLAQQSRIDEEVGNRLPNIDRTITGLSNLWNYSKGYLKNKFNGDDSGILLNLADKNVSRIMSHTGDVETILTNDFVENNNNMVRKKKDFINTTDTLLGDKKIPLSKISTFYGIEDGKLKAGPLDIFDDNTVVVPNRAKYVGRIKEYHPSVPDSKAFLDAVQKGIVEYNNSKGYEPNWLGKILGETPQATLLHNLRKEEDNTREGLKRASDRRMDIINNIREKYSYLNDGALPYVVTENNDTIRGYDLNASPKALFVNENGDAVFVANPRNHVKELNSYLQEHPMYPVMVDNGRYASYQASFPNVEAYAGLNRPNNMFIIGTTKKKALGGNIYDGTTEDSQLMDTDGGLLSYIQRMLKKDF